MKTKFFKFTICFLSFFSVVSISFCLGYLSGIENTKKVYQRDFRLISKSFNFPLEKKYYIASVQGLRDSMTAESTGGQATSGLWHNGIDFACPEKTKVFATKAGTVIANYPSFYNGKQWKGHPVYGGLVIIEHNDGTKTLYAHLSRTDVHEGQRVKKGEQIGLSGGIRGKRGSGISTGAHLHFAEYLDMGDFIDDLHL